MMIKVKFFGTLAQLFIGKSYVGSIRYEKHKTQELEPERTLHTLYLKGEQVAEFEAQGGIFGSHFSK